MPHHCTKQQTLAEQVAALAAACRSRRSGGTAWRKSLVTPSQRGRAAPAPRPAAAIAQRQLPSPSPDCVVLRVPTDIDKHQQTREVTQSAMEKASDSEVAVVADQSAVREVLDASSATESDSTHCAASSSSSGVAQPEETVESISSAVAPPSCSDDSSGVAQLEETVESISTAAAPPSCSDDVCGVGRAASPLTVPLCRFCRLRPAAMTKCDKCSGGKVPCTRCSGTGRFMPQCRSCDGAGFSRRDRNCRVCNGKGKVDRGDCNGCHGAGGRQCYACQGTGLPTCVECAAKLTEQRRQAAREREQAPPPPGVSISACSAGELSSLAGLWSERGGSSTLVGAWKVDNPLLTHRYHERRQQLKAELGREPDELQGFHGTHPGNVISISETGFDSNRRAGQVFGAGEYFAKNPCVSICYCSGGDCMFICRLCLGWQSSDQSNVDGDHIWVPDEQYYVISQPDQILPQYIVRFKSGRGSITSQELETVLSLPRWSTKRERQVMHVPANRPCAMSMPSTNALWMGYLHGHLADDDLEVDIRTFFAQHAPSFTDGLRVHIASGKYKKAHVQLVREMPRELVHKLNRLPFVEGGVERRICVDDAHGSPQQKCPRWIAGYCRGRNLRYTHSCWCSHQARPTEGARYKLVEVDLYGAKGTEVWEKFMQSTPFHDGSYPNVVALHAVQNETLSRLHEEYRAYLRNKNKEEPAVRELYHGTNNNILSNLFTHGLQPPADFSASDACPVSGRKGLCTSLCNNDCKLCVERHEWNRCHMFGLGIYLADISQKSHRYCSQPEVLPNGRWRYRMVLCSVLGRPLEVAGYLRVKDVMHDVPNVRALGSELVEMIEPHGCSVPGKQDVEQADILAIKGLGCDCRPGYSVVNSEYIAYHPYQCLPKYQITYEV